VKIQKELEGLLDLPKKKRKITGKNSVMTFLKTKANRGEK